METLSENPFSGKTYLYTIASRLDPRFYFFWPMATLHRSARSSKTTEESCAENFEFAEGRAQFWVFRNVGDGIAGHW